MITNEGKEYLRGIGLLAENVICEADSYDEKKDNKEGIIQSMAQTTARMKAESKLLSIADIKELLDKHNVAFVEYVDMLDDAVKKEVYDNNDVKFKADAVVSIVLDIIHREIRSDEIYKKIADGEINENVQINGGNTNDQKY